MTGRRAAVAWLLALAVAVFGFGEVLLVRTYRTADGSPGLSLSDVRQAFTEGSQSLLEARLRTDMAEHVDPAELGVLLAWARSGGGREGYDQGVAAIVERECLGCHKANGRASFRPLETYAQVAETLHEPPSPPFRAMVTITKTHAVGIGALLAIPVLVPPRNRAANRRVGWAVCAGYAGLALDFGMWWMMRLDPVFAVGRLVGHALLVGGFATSVTEAVLGLWASRNDP